MLRRLYRASGPASFSSSSREHRNAVAARQAPSVQSSNLQGLRRFSNHRKGRDLSWNTRAAAAAFEGNQTASGGNGVALVLPKPSNEETSFTPFGAEDVRRYVAGKPHLLSRVGPVETSPGWKVKEIGDGNLNYVWMVEGPAGAVVFKQGPPHLKADPAVPLTQERARFEAESLTKAAQHAAEYVPRVYYYDPNCSVIITELLRPHVPLRGALISGRTLPNMPAHLASYLANVMFHTSLLSMDLDMWSREMHWFQNREMANWAAVTNFEHAFTDAPTNRHNSPYLDAEALAFRQDVPARVAAAHLQAKFYLKQQALIHADMHTGALLVTESSTKVFDSEFSTVGPMAFDIGTFTGNLLVSFFASDGLASAERPRTQQALWILQAVVELWETFRAEFLGLWERAAQRGTGGALCPAQLFGPDSPGGPEALKARQEAFMEELWEETLGFAGGALIRRILTTASLGVNDFNAIQDPAIKAVCQRRALRLGRRLLVHPATVPSPADLIALANDERLDGAQPCFPLPLEAAELQASVSGRVRQRLAALQQSTVRSSRSLQESSLARR
eukprot:jgi/Botrbrau1/23482/Bobra.106_1s0034.1